MVDHANPDWPVAFQNGPIGPESNDFTVCILGVPRGGTTMTAGIVQRCGLWIGDNLPENLEDPDFHKHPVERMIESAKLRNAERSAWGWKYPHAAAYFRTILPHLKSPRLIMVWRDPLAVSARAIKHGNPAKNAIPYFMQYFNSNAQLASELDIPILHVSYEKAVRDPVDAAKPIARFIGMKPPNDSDELLRFAQPRAYK